jgi:transcriptional regulator with XRE-family HTH domain
VAHYRRGAGLSQETLAEKAGLSRNYISLLEGGQRQPSLETALQIQRALGVAWEHLLHAAFAERSVREEATAYRIKADDRASPELEPLIHRLRKCSPEEIHAIAAIVQKVLKLHRPQRKNIPAKERK